MTSTIGVKKIQYPNGTDILTLDSSGTLAIGGSITSNITTTGTVNTPSINGGQIGGRRNIVYNGAMQVAQRGNQNTSNGTNTFGVDRFLVYLRGGAAATVSKDTDVPSGQGFSSSCKIDITTGDALGTANDLALFRQLFEGQDLQQLKKGTSNAEKVTVSFWIKSTITGTYILELDDVDNTRGISKSYTVSSSNTWEHKTITFEGDTTGAFDNDNANSLRLTWALGAGSDFQGVTLSTSWASISDGDARYEGQVNAVNSDSNNIYFTGIQMEIGSQATPFEHRSFGEELALCQRYYTVIVDGSETNPSTFGMGAMYNATNVYGSIILPTEMRTGPTLDAVTGTNYYYFYRNGDGDGFNSVTLSISQKGGIEFYNQTEISGTAGHAGFFRSVHGSAKIALTAEL